MQVLTANQAKTQFGKTLMDVQKHPVKITKNGQPVAMMMSMDEFTEMEEMKLQLLKNRVAQAEIDIAEGNTVDGEAFFEKLLAE